MSDRQPAPSSPELTPMGRLRPLFMARIGLAGGVLLLLLGGRWDWIEGWLLAAIFFLYLVGTSLWVVRPPTREIRPRPCCLRWPRVI